MTKARLRGRLYGRRSAAAAPPPQRRPLMRLAAVMRTVHLRPQKAKAGPCVGIANCGVTVRTPSGPVKGASADVEGFARNIARMVEEGGKALAAYLKPREEGRRDDQYVEITDVVKTIGQVADYWLRDPQRALELQSSLGKAYLDLWASAVKRMAGEQVQAVAEPDPRDKRFADPEWSSNQFFDFL